jgi:AcrR family transcriptional regulator
VRAHVGAAETEPREAVVGRRVERGRGRLDVGEEAASAASEPVADGDIADRGGRRRGAHGGGRVPRLDRRAGRRPRRHLAGDAYQHFRSRLELVDAICERFDENPALLAIREAVELPDADAALAETIAHAVRFWSSEDSILGQLYGVVAIDPAAQAFVKRQRADRRGEMTRLVRNLERAGRLREGLTEEGALSLLMVLTSYETFCELRLAGSADPAITGTLHVTARTLLLG